MASVHVSESISSFRPRAKPSPGIDPRIQLVLSNDVALFVTVSEFHQLVDVGNAAVRALQEQQESCDN
ncbi:hypothetical protein RhoFasGS6_03894 [Rhodococcus fascians]|uniref:hypothetical protein n=1 Tax=Rhodococcoides fascians TaxID=1828 RepID=UPI001427CB42|nr:hypothetical protein [Rhodococcus fascians]